jgi:phage repressor protein C with HTH and peptisase S24 domain
LRDCLRRDVARQSARKSRVAFEGSLGSFEGGKSLDVFGHEQIESTAFNPLQANLSVKLALGKGSFHFMKTTGDRIRFVRNLHRLSQDKFAKAVSEINEVRVTRGAVGNWELDQGIKHENLVQISTRFEVSLDWLSAGKGKPPFNPDQFPSESTGDDGRPHDGILEIDVRAGLGGGGSTEGREVRHDGNYSDPVKSESWKFPARFMREEIRATESQVIILETDGDSMEPTIGSGERVIVHTGMRRPTPDGIFALRDTFGNIVAKRLQVLRKGDPPRVLVISDNKAHAPEEVGLDEITIVGRVLWGLKRL